MQSSPGASWAVLRHRGVVLKEGKPMRAGEMNRISTGKDRGRERAGDFLEKSPETPKTQVVFVVCTTVG